MFSVRPLLVAFLAIAASFVYPWSAEACRCGGPADPCTELKRQVVFTATAIRIPEPDKEGRLPHLPRFQVHEVFSGTPSGVVEVGSGPGNCGFDFRTGEQYIIYATVVDGQLMTGMCTRTGLLAEHREELEVLRELKRGIRKTRLMGRVGEARVRLDGGPPKGDFLPLPGVLVTATSSGASYSATSDSSGEYRFTGIRPGAYSIRAHLPARYPQNDDKKTTVLECFAKVSFAATRVRLSGALTRRVGNWPDLSGHWITAVAVDANGTIVDASRRMDTFTDREGRWSFRGLPPGRYKVGANVFNKRKWDPWQQPVWYGGALDASNAQVIEIGESGTQNIVIQFPPAPAEIQIEGVLVNAGGKAANGDVVLHDTAAGHSVGESSTDGSGRFFLRGWQGRRYTIVGSACSSAGLTSENIEVPHKTHEPIRVTLTKPCKRP
jgi:Carboxypeptidase regulatory-like domain